MSYSGLRHSHVRLESDIALLGAVKKVPGLEPTALNMSSEVPWWYMPVMSALRVRQDLEFRAILGL